MQSPQHQPDHSSDHRIEKFRRGRKRISAPPTSASYPNTQYDQQSGKPGTTTYVVDNTVYVTVHQLDKLGDLLDATVQAGANNINSIQFDVFDKTSALKQARTRPSRTRKGRPRTCRRLRCHARDVQTISFTNTIPQPVTICTARAAAQSMHRRRCRSAQAN